MQEHVARSYSRRGWGPTGLLGRQVETSNTSPAGAGALSVAGTHAIARPVATLKTLNEGKAATQPTN